MSTYTLKNSRIDWSNISKHANRKATKAWIAVVHDYDQEKYKYNWDQDFLDSSEIDNNVMVSVQELTDGDVIRVSGGSHSKDYTACFEVISVSDEELEVERLKEYEAIEKVQSDDQNPKQELRDLVNSLDEEQAEEALEELSHYRVSKEI